MDGKVMPGDGPVWGERTTPTWPLAKNANGMILNGKLRNLVPNAQLYSHTVARRL